MNVYLCFCPAADPAMPHAALPALGARLKSDGNCDYALRDLNLEAFLYFLTEDKVSRAARCVSSRLEQGRIESGSLREEARKLLEDTGLAGRIESSVASLRDPEAFYNPRTFFQQKDDFRAACRLISLQFDRIGFGKYLLFESFSYDSYDEILTAVENPEARMLTDFYRERFLPDIALEQPEIVGMSVSYFPQLIPTFLLAREIRKVSPGTHITLGGPVVTWGKDTMVRDAGGFSTLIDSFCVGEGEHCISRLVTTLGSSDSSPDFSSVPGLVWFDEGKARINPPGSPDIDLADLPAPDYDSMPLEDYLAPERIISMPLTKGCNYNLCKFCNYAFIKLTGYRERPVEKTVQDLARIVRQTGDRVFSFETDVIRPRYMREFVAEILRTGLDIKWHGVMRFHQSLDREFFETLARAGCRRMYFGLESANARILKKMVKGTTPRIIEANLKCCGNAGIATEVGVFLGYPEETVEEARDSLNFIKRNREHVTRADVGFFRLLKGAPVVDEIPLDQFLPGKSPMDYWYMMEYRNPIVEDNHDEFLRIFHELESMFPILKAMDISEEILFLARYGKDTVEEIVRTYNDRFYPSPAEGENILTPERYYQLI